MSRKHRDSKDRSATGVGTTQLNSRILQHIRALGLIGLAESQVEDLLSWSVKEQPSYSAFLERVLAVAAADKHQRCIERRFKESGLVVKKTLETFDWGFQPKLDRKGVEELAALGFIERREDVLLTGKTGTGKSHILQALALNACLVEHTVRYARCVDLIDDLYAGLADGSYEGRLRRWSRPRLLVVDDVGLGQIKKRDDEPTAAHILFNLIDRRHQQASTALTSNIKLSQWGKYLGDTTIAAAILDRLAMTTIRIDIDGPSYRQYLARKRAGGQAAATESTSAETCIGQEQQ